MTSTAISPVILCGGSGTRLWPLSTPDKPKQFLNLLDDKSLFAHTLERVADRTRFTPPVIICGKQHAALVAEQCAYAGCTDATIIVEPAARNTAPAIALAAHMLAETGATMLVMPSDHAIQDNPAFLAAVMSALPAARNGALVTFGITPTRPETGYGYIAAGAPYGEPPLPVRTVEKFVEKPVAEAAAAMIAAGGHYWNAGIFLMQADAYLDALLRYQPDMHACTGAAMTLASRTGQMLQADETAFAQSPSDSIDYAVMEHADNVVVVPVDPGWSDVGSWSALYALGDHDASGNQISGAVTAIDSHNNLVHAPGLAVAMVGIDDHIVVADGKRILIIPQSRAQEVKRIVDQLNAAAD